MAYQGSRPPQSPRRRPFQISENTPPKLQPNSESGIPYIDANEDTNEIPLDQIDTFVIPSRDEKGSFIRVTLQLPPYLIRQLQILVKSNRFPYLEPTDAIRHAIYRHIGFCVRIRESIPKSIVPSLDAMMEVCRDNDFRIRIHEAFQEVERQLSLCVNRGEIGEAVRLLNMIKKRMDGVPPSEHQREIMSLIQKDYNYVLGQNGDLVKGDEAGKKKK